MHLRATVRDRQFTKADFIFLAALLSAIGSLLAGLLLPAFTNDRLAEGKQSLSILGGALSLGEAGSVLLMLVIILFSVIFPVAKLGAMLALWSCQFKVRTEERTMHWLEILGKWSMLDVFVIATTIGAAHLKLLNKTTTEIGIYIFGLGILLSMLASILLRQRLKTRISLAMSKISSAERTLGLVVGFGSLVLFFLGISLPLFTIEKWLFWDKEYSLLTALPQMVAEGELLLPVVVVVFVIVLPLCRFVALSAARLSKAPGKTLVQIAFGFEKWTMWEVYALALIVVGVKLADFTTLEFRAGFWLIMCMVPLSLFDGWLFKRRLDLSKAPA